jgi:pantoate--beta-alanine ligase
MKEGSIETITSIQQMQIHSQKIRESGATIAFVPTMGFLHEGHLSLMRMARSLADHIVVSIFVNPTQFDPGEDFEVYPRDIDQDSKKVKTERVDTLFLPNTVELYPSTFETYIRLENLPKRLCGRFRSHHFTGVATIVAKFFNIVRPNIAIFGKKDYQQWIIIRRMVHDLNMNVEIIGAPIVRESDGLAMSSRNSYLKKEERIKALSLYKALTTAEKKVAAGARNAVAIIQEAVDSISIHEGVAIDYVSICDPETLDDVTEINKSVLMALAVKVGKTRLIDNLLLTPS